MSTYQRHEPFECSRLKDTCEIGYDVVEHSSGRRKAIDREIVGGFMCDSTRACRVEDASGNFHWAECVHPKSPN